MATGVVVIVNIAAERLGSVNININGINTNNGRLMMVLDLVRELIQKTEGVLFANVAGKRIRIWFYRGFTGYALLFPECLCYNDLNLPPSC